MHWQIVMILLILSFNASRQKSAGIFFAKKRSGDVITTSLCYLEKHHLTALAFKK